MEIREIRQSLREYVKNYILVKQTGIIALMRELERSSPAELAVRIPEKKKGRIHGVHLGTDLFFYKVAEIFYEERMSRRERIKDKFYTLLDFIVDYED